MRLYSTPKSALAGEVTVLAILETTAATAFSVWLWTHQGTVPHIAIAACLAPLLLLGTDRSTDLAERWIVKVLDSITLPGNFFGAVLAIPASLLLMPTAIVLMRTSSILVATLRHPLQALEAIPTNWFRIVFSTLPGATPSPPRGSRLLTAAGHSSAADSRGAKDRLCSWSLSAPLAHHSGLLIP